MATAARRAPAHPSIHVPANPSAGAALMIGAVPAPMIASAPPTPVPTANAEGPDESAGTASAVDVRTARPLANAVPHRQVTAPLVT